jgi:integrase
MPSSWIIRRETASGPRYRVLYRLGGRESSAQYAGSFKRQEDARARKRWVDGELANLRVPDLAALELAPARASTVSEAAERWRESRVDVSDGTRVLHRVALARVLPVLGDRRVDEIDVAAVNQLVSSLAVAGKKRETIKKSVKYLAAVLDEQGLEENPARSKRIRYPHEERIEIQPPTSEHVEAVCRLLPSSYRLALLWLDWSGARVASVDSVLVGDYDEPRRRIRLRASTTKTRSALWVELPDVLAEAIEATLRPREDRDLKARLFSGVGADKLRTAIARACKAAGVPVFSPHDLRHRRISLLHRQRRTWAEIGRLVGQRKLSVTADTYTHVLVDEELDYAAVLA